MRNVFNSIAWFPDCQWSAKSGTIIDQEFLDFDEQAERLVGHDQDYMQLSDGPFRGRFVSCFLGEDVSLHIEQANQALTQDIGAASDCYSIGVVLPGPDLFRANGFEIDRWAVFIVPPKAVFHLYSPQNGCIMACVVNKSHLDKRLASAPHVHNWILGLGAEIGYLRAPSIAHRLRQDAYNAMSAACTLGDAPLDQSWLGDALVSSFVSSLILDWNAEVQPFSSSPTKSFRRFIEVKSKLMATQTEPLSIDMIAEGLNISKRSIHYVFASELSQGVSSYFSPRKIARNSTQLAGHHKRYPQHR